MKGVSFRFAVSVVAAIVAFASVLSFGGDRVPRTNIINGYRGGVPSLTLTTVAPVALYKLPTAKATLNQPAIGPTPGMPRSWQAGRSVYGGTVNLASGNLLLSHHIAGWKCKGFAISFGFYFNSQSTDSSSVGAKWSHSYDWKVSGTNPAVVTSGDGTKTSFALGPNGYEAPAGIHEDIVHNANGTWTLKFQGGSEFRFDSDGKLTQQVDSNGNTTNLAYANGLLSTVTDAANRTLTLGYRRA